MAQAAWISETRLLRFASASKWQEWVETIDQKYQIYKKRGFNPIADHASPISALAVWGSVTETALYDWDFWRDIELLRGGDKAPLESAIAFLEADPWFHGSGYAKEILIPAIIRLDLPPKLAERLRTVVLNMVDRRNGREFRAFCRLARKVDAPALREQLTARLISGDAGIRRRARWVLEALAQKDRQEKNTRGRTPML